jgi:hypothetical protein
MSYLMCARVLLRILLRVKTGLPSEPNRTLGTDGTPHLAETADDVNVMSTDVSAVIAEKFPGFAASAFLGGTQTHDARKWLDGFLLRAGREVLGSLGGRSVEFLQVMHHLVFGTYFVYTRGRMSAGPMFLLSLVDPRVRRALRRFLRKPWRRPFGLSIGIVQAPDILPDGRVDMCESCPDMTWFNGRLVNSCRLDEHRIYGGLLTAVPRERSAIMWASPEKQAAMS